MIRPTTTATGTTTGSSTTSESGTSRRKRSARALLFGLATATATALGLGQSVSPASAATGVSYCFVQTDGSPLYLETTSLQVWNGWGWLTVAYGRTSSNGCGSFTTGHYWQSHVRVAAGTFTSRLVGQTPYTAGPGSGNVHLGTGVVWMRWI